MTTSERGERRSDEFWDITIEGLENVRTTGPGIIAANDLAFCDSNGSEPGGHELQLQRRLWWHHVVGRNVQSSAGIAVTTQDPSPKPIKGPNIRGPKAWALLRTLIEVAPPYAVGELAAAVDTDAGYVSRVLTALSDELLITRPPRGKVQHVEWEALVRQLASSYALLDANETTNWVASAGPEQFLDDLSSSKLKQWAVTGSFAAARAVSVAAPEIAVVYADDPERIADTLRLRQVRNGGNVVLARPYDQIVFERTTTTDDITYVSPAQVAIDCLTGPGRMPAEGEALVEWMSDKPSRWQAPSLARDDGRR